MFVKLFKKCSISNAMDGTDSSEDTNNTEIEEDDTPDIDSEEEFLAFCDE